MGGGLCHSKHAKPNLAFKKNKTKNKIKNVFYFVFNLLKARLGESLDFDDIEFKHVNVVIVTNAAQCVFVAEFVTGTHIFVSLLCELL
jgi:hypothetical protein